MQGRCILSCLFRKLTALSDSPSEIPNRNRDSNLKSRSLALRSETPNRLDPSNRGRRRRAFVQLADVRGRRGTREALQRQQPSFTGNARDSEAVVTFDLV
jgi:hypothetical protein